MNNEKLLEIKNLRQYFPVTEGVFKRKIGEITNGRFSFVHGVVFFK